MKIAQIPSVCLILCLLLIVLAGCKQREVRPCIPITRLETWRPFLATVDRIYLEQIPDTNLAQKETVLIGLDMKGGKKIFIIDSGTNSDMLIGFSHTLKEGQTYGFPKTWLDYKTSEKLDTNVLAK